MKNILSVVFIISAVHAYEAEVTCPHCQGQLRVHVPAPENPEERLRQLQFQIQIKELEKELAEKEAKRKERLAKEKAREIPERLKKKFEEVNESWAQASQMHRDLIEKGFI